MKINFRKVQFFLLELMAMLLVWFVSIKYIAKYSAEPFTFSDSFTEIIVLIVTYSLAIILGLLFCRQREKILYPFDVFLLLIIIHGFFQKNYVLLPISYNYIFFKYSFSFLLFWIIASGIPLFISIRKYSSQKKKNAGENIIDIEAVEIDSPIIPDFNIGTDIDINLSKVERIKSLKKIDSEGLEFFPFAEKLVEGIKPFVPKEKAFSIGINGDWGSGKSSLIDIVKELLPEKILIKKDGSNYQVKQISFSPWMYPDEQSLIVNFFEEWKEIFQDNYKIHSYFSNYVEILTSVEKEVFKTQITKLLFPENKSLKTINKAIVDAIKKENIIYYFFIDDLDRVGQKELIEVIRLCRILADFPNTIYVLAYDRKYIDKALKELIDDEQKQAEYFNKIVQLEFKMPQINENKFGDVFYKTFEKQLQSIDLLNEDRGKVLRDISKKSYLKKYLLNLRGIKRFCNSFLVRYKLNHDKVDFYTFFLFEMFHHRFRDSYNNIYTNYDNWVIFIGDRKEIKHEQGPSIINCFGISEKDVQDTYEILTDIYCNAKPNNIRNNLSSYFTLTEIDGFISQKEFDSWERDSNNNKQKQLLNKWMNELFFDSFLDMFKTYLSDRIKTLSQSKLNDYGVDQTVDYLMSLILIIIQPLILKETIIKNLSEEALANLIYELIADIYKHESLTESGKYNVIEMLSALLDTGTPKLKRLLFEKFTKFGEINIVSDKETEYVKSLHPKLNKTPFNIRGKSFDEKSYGVWNENTLDVLKQINAKWITRAEKLDGIECKELSPEFLFERTFYSHLSIEQIDSVKLFIQADDFCHITFNEKNGLVYQRNGFNFSNQLVNEPIEIETSFIRFGMNKISFKIRNMDIRFLGNYVNIPTEKISNDDAVRDNPYGFIYWLQIIPKQSNVLPVSL